MSARSLSADSPAGWPRRVITAALITAAILLADAAGLTAAADRWIGDLRAMPVRYEPSGDIVLVDIDPQSLAEVGVWPWPRSMHAALLETANALGAHRVAFDIDFSARTDADGDEAFANALAASSAETFLASFVQAPSTDRGVSAVSLPIDPLLHASWPAGVNLPLDPDGRARLFVSRVDTESETLISMPSLLADREIEADLIGINHSIDANVLPRVSYVDLMNGRVDAAEIAGKTLIVGATAIELRDLFLAPVHGVVSGSTIIALATETLLQRRELRPLTIPFLAIPLLIGLHLVASRRWRMKEHLFGLFGLAMTVEVTGFALHHVAGLSLKTGVLIAVLAALALVVTFRELNVRSLLAALSRAEAGNSRRVLDRVVETGFDGIVIVDAKDRIVRANPAAKRLPLHRGPGALNVLADLPAEVQSVVRDARRSGGSQGPLGRTFDVVVGATGNGAPPTILELSVALLEMVSTTVAGTSSRADHVCLTFRDVTDARQSQDTLRALALQDSLTELANRRALELSLANAREMSSSPFALLIFDLDRFKSVNDTLGHAVGDEVLVEVGRRAASILASSGTVARMGGDEFAAVLPGIDAETANGKARALADAINRPFLVRGHRVSVGTSVGMAFSDSGDWEVDRIVRQADLALNAAKECADESRIVLFQPEMEHARLARLKLEGDLDRALDEGQFELAYQPQVNVSDGTIIGAEALLRWRHPVTGYVSPALFIPVAEEIGLIHRLGEWVMNTACRDAAAWPIPISIAVNVSSIQFAAGDLVCVVERALETSSLGPDRLEIEITESAFIRESDQLSRTFATLRQRGIRFALDDFGTGYSSLGYLHRFPITKIKIDRQFITGLPGEQSSMAIVRSIQALSHGLSIRTIAEGVETDLQVECLRMLGCREIQGFVYYRPMSNFDLRNVLLTQASDDLDGRRSA